MTNGRPTSKNIYFLRAFSGKTPLDIEAGLKKARGMRPNVADTEIEAVEGEIFRVQRCLPKANPNFFHFVRYVPGDLAPTLESHAITPEDIEGVLPAPAGKEFKDGECFLMASGCNLLFLGHGITVQRVESYIRMLFSECAMDKSLCHLQMEPVANVDKVQLMQDQGVRSIRLSASLYDLDIPAVSRTTTFSRVKGFIGDEVSALLQKDDDVAALKAAEDLIVSIELRLDGNTRAVGDAKDFMDDLATTTIDDENLLTGFVIVTRDGVPISPTEVRLHQKTSFNVSNKSLNVISVQEAMGSYLADLNDLNLLE